MQELSLVHPPPCSDAGAADRAPTREESTPRHAEETTAEGSRSRTIRPQSRWRPAIRQLSTGALSAAEIGLGLKVIATAAVLPLLLRLLPLPTLLRWLRPRRTGRRPEDHTLLERQVHVARRVLGSDDGPLRHSCLLRSLVLFRSLRRAGYPVVVCFGITRDGESLAGHAWLELDGAAVGENGGVLAGYRPIYRYPDDAST